MTVHKLTNSSYKSVFINVMYPELTSCVYTCRLGLIVHSCHLRAVAMQRPSSKAKLPDHEQQATGLANLGTSPGLTELTDTHISTKLTKLAFSVVRERSVVLSFL